MGMFCFLLNRSLLNCLNYQVKLNYQIKLIMNWPVRQECFNQL